MTGKAFSRGKQIGKSSLHWWVMVLMALAALWSGVASAITSDGVDLDLDPSHSLFWRTVSGSSVELSIDWPSAARTAILTIGDNSGASPIRVLIEREGSSAGTVCNFTPVQPKNPGEERVYRAELVYCDETNTPLADETRTASFGAVLGHGNGAVAFVRNPKGNRWSRAVGEYVVLKVDEGIETLDVDGCTVETGLEGAPGWYGARYGSGEHTVSVNGSPFGCFRVSGGLIISVR